jgi:hypothetical protein
MHLSETVVNILFVIVVILLLVLSIYIRIRRVKRSLLGRVASILVDLNKNQKLMDNFSFHHAVKGFRTSAWKKNRDRVTFLPQELLKTLSQVFEICEEINDRINSAKKFKSDSYMASIDLSRLKAPLAQSQRQLREWIQENMQNPDYLPKRRRGLFRF